MWLCSVEGEMDRLRIMTTDLNSYPMDEIKTEPHILIKQECQQSQQSFFVKSEIQDYDEVSPNKQIHRCVTLEPRSTSYLRTLHQRRPKTFPCQLSDPTPNTSAAPRPLRPRFTNVAFTSEGKCQCKSLIRSLAINEYSSENQLSINEFSNFSTGIRQHLFKSFV